MFKTCLCFQTSPTFSGVISKSVRGCNNKYNNLIRFYRTTANVDNNNNNNNYNNNNKRNSSLDFNEYIAKDNFTEGDLTKIFLKKEESAGLRPNSKSQVEKPGTQNVNPTRDTNTRDNVLYDPDPDFVGYKDVNYYTMKRRYREITYFVTGNKNATFEDYLNMTGAVIGAGRDRGGGRNRGRDMDGDMDK
eukprot:Pgem_evm1s3236